eukprot:scaffold204415_cov50-Prasinocladus_malaysianus.AAC.1
MNESWTPRWFSPEIGGNGKKPPGCWGHTLSYCEGVPTWRGVGCTTFAASDARNLGPFDLTDNQQNFKGHIV